MCHGCNLQSSIKRLDNAYDSFKGATYRDKFKFVGSEEWKEELRYLRTQINELLKSPYNGWRERPWENSYTWWL